MKLVESVENEDKLKLLNKEYYTQTELACTVNISTVHEPNKLKLYILLNDNQTKTRWLDIWNVYAHTYKTCIHRQYILLKGTFHQ